MTDGSARGFTRSRLLVILAVLFALWIGASGMSLIVGSQSISFPTAWADGESTDALILFNYRLPWTVLAAVVGAGLASVGCVFQAILRNPLADPYILGMSNGAALGICLSISAGGSIYDPAFGFVGALLTTLIVWRLSRVRGRTDSTTMLLAGVVVNAILGASILFLVSMAKPDTVQQIMIWMLGNLDVHGVSVGLRWTAAGLAGLGMILAMFLGRDLNAMSLGDDHAIHLGVSAERVRTIAIVLGSIVVGACVSIAGPIGFVGLLVPHLLRMILGADHRLLLPASILGGASFLLVAGSLARMAFRMNYTQMPVGVLTAMVGGPYFLWLLMRERSRD